MDLSTLLIRLHPGRSDARSKIESVRMQLTVIFNVTAIYWQFVILYERPVLFYLDDPPSSWRPPETETAAFRIPESFTDFGFYFSLIEMNKFILSSFLISAS